jgi:hypothetical protein
VATWSIRRTSATARRSRSSPYCASSYHGEIDAFGIYCPETTGVYLVPIEAVPTTSAAHLRVDPPKNNQFDRIRFAANYEVGRIAIEGLRVSSGA